MKGRRASGAAAGDAAPSLMALRTRSLLVPRMQSSLAPRTSSSSSSGMQSSVGMWDVVAWPEEVCACARTDVAVPVPVVVGAYIGRAAAHATPRSAPPHDTTAGSLHPHGMARRRSERDRRAPLRLSCRWNSDSKARGSRSPCGTQRQPTRRTVQLA
jgi:hypothetical protein